MTFISDCKELVLDWI